MDLTVGMLEAEEALQLFLSNNFDEAEAKMAKHCGHSIYHALGHGCILFIRAMMSCERDGTLRSPFAAMSLLGHQLVMTYMIGAEEPDLALCTKLIEPLVKKYPNGAIILFLLARFRLVSGRLDEALQLYRRSIRAQHIYRQFHHICHWELLIGNALLMHWNRAAWHAKKLLDESRWSKCIYAYFLAILIDADEKAKRRKEAVRVLMRKVPANRVKIAGKSLPMEKFCERRALKWLERDGNAEDRDTDGGDGAIARALNERYKQEDIYKTSRYLAEKPVLPGLVQRFSYLMDSPMRVTEDMRVKRYNTRKQNGISVHLERFFNPGTLSFTNPTNHWPNQCPMGGMATPTTTAQQQ